MTHRERIVAALKHQTPDQVPFGIHFAAAKYEEFVARTGALDTSEYFDLDYRKVIPAPPKALPDFGRYFEGRVPDWPDMREADFSLTPFREERSYFSMGAHNTAMNEWGEYRIYEECRDYHRKVCPLDHPGCTVAEVERFPFPDLSASWRYDGIEKEIDSLHARGLAAVLPWEMTIFEKAWRIRGVEELLLDFTFNPELVECLLAKIAERTGCLALRYARAGVDIIQFGDDIGTQRGMMISPGHWRRFLKPLMADMIARVKNANPEVLVFYHSDGIFEPVIPDLIEIGVEILNPVQPECTDLSKLKHVYGDRLSFWGGIGVQSTMPFGTPDDVRAAVKQLMEDASMGGGLLIAPAHLIERDVPWENVLALAEAVRNFGRGGK